MPAIKSKNFVKSNLIYKRPEQINRTIGIREFYEKYNKILIKRACGGLGDILMHRMIFEDFKKLMPDAEIHFSCPKAYHDAVSDHPFVDKLLDSNNQEENDHHNYMIHYNTTTACGRWETSMAPMSGKHRSDIWANHCGVELTNHEMHFRLSEEEKRIGKSILEKNRDKDGKTVVLAPISAMHNKNLSDELMCEVAEQIRSLGYFVIGIHNVPIHALKNNKIPYIHGLSIKECLSVIDQSDYVISVDTAHFHAAGGLKKPVVGVFTFVHSETYSMYYPKVEKVQGPCPLKYCGCYNWGSCPSLKTSTKVACCSGITSKMIVSSFNSLVEKYPFS